MSAWLNNLDVVTLFIDDVARTKSFYQDVFGLSPIFENENSIVFNLDNTSLNFLQRDTAPELVVARARLLRRTQVRNFQFTIRVDSVDEGCAELARRGVKLNNGPIDRPGAYSYRQFLRPRWLSLGDR